MGVTKFETEREIRENREYIKKLMVKHANATDDKKPEIERKMLDAKKALEHWEKQL
jgi:DNA-binding transcriptional regulator GbsR (MarR family)